MSSDKPKSLADLTAHLFADKPAAPAPVEQKPAEHVRKKPLFEQYVEHGWKLCRIKEGTKRPVDGGWNKPDRVITDAMFAGTLSGCGLVHEFSGTAVLDIDNVDLARFWLKDHGVDLDALINDPAAVRIHSGDSARGKLVYALPSPLPTKKILNEDKSINLFELRCAGGQDVLPPSLNPRTGERYEWIGDWRNLPPLPESLRVLWSNQVRPIERPTREQLAPSAGLDELRRLISSKDPSAPYDEWLRIGAILHHETDGSDEGLQLWDEWSAPGSSYKGIEDLEPHWNSFGKAANPATAGSLRREDVGTVDELGPAPAAQVDNDDIMESAEDERAARIASVKWQKLGEYKIRPLPEMLIKKVLPRKPLGAAYGPSGAGKSFSLLDIGLAIVRGISWRGHKTRQGAVGWLAAEAAGSMRNRVLAYEKGHSVTVDDLEFYVLGEGIDLTNRERVRLIAEAAKPLSLVLVIVDTLAAASGSANENSGEDMNPVLDNCALLHEITGAAVLLIHHSGKDEAKGMRGWSGVRARLDYEMEIKKRDDELREITMTKQRDGEEGAAMPVKLVSVEIGTDEDGEVVTSAYVEHVDARNALEKHNAEKKGQGKYHKAIRGALLDAPDMRLEVNALIAAAVLRVPEDRRPSTADKQVRATLREMTEVTNELRYVGVVGGYYEFTQRPIRGNPDHARGAREVAEVTPVDDAEAEL